MRFNSLTIHNIASIENAVIHFDESPLNDADVFLITGKTGAGKTTILDSICLALYATTPRMENSNMEGYATDTDADVKIKDPAQLLRRNTGEGSVILTFTGNNGILYESQWCIRRARGRADGKLQRRRRTLSFSRDGKSVILTKDKDIDSEICEAVGHTFRQFCRTTMLAQGEFTRFLDSKDRDKAEILERITNVYIYSEIGRKVYEITRRHETAYNDAVRLCDDITPLSHEQLEAMHREEDELTGQIKHHTSCAAVLEARLRRIADEKALISAVATAAETLDKARAETLSDSFIADSTLVTQWRATDVPRSLCRIIASASADNARLGQRLDKLAGEHRALCAARASLAADIDVMTSRATATRQAVKGLISSAADNACIADAIGDGLTRCDEAATLTDMRKQLVNTISLIKDIDIALMRLDMHDQAVAADKALRDDIAARKQALSALTAGLEPMRQKLAEAAAARDKARRDYDAQLAAVNDWARAMRATLQPGDMCPVCRRRIDAAMPDESSLAALYAVAERTRDEAVTNHDALMNKMTRLEAEISTQQSGLKRDCLRLERDTTIDDTRESAAKACMACGIDSTTGDASGILTAKLRRLTASRDAISTRITEAEGTIRKYNRLIDELNNILSAVALKRSVLSSVDVIMSRISIPGHSVGDVDSAQTRPDAHDNLISRCNRLDADIKATLSLMASNTDAITKAQAELQQFISDHPDISLERIAALNDIPAERISDISRHADIIRCRCNEAETRHRQLVEQLEEYRKTSPELDNGDTPENLRDRLTGISDMITRDTRRIGELTQQLRDDRALRSRLNELTAQIDTRRDTYLKWAELDNLIGDATGNKFRKIAQSFILVDLIRTANIYMRSLSNRYTLHVTPGSFVINIEDAYQGYTRRPANTSSGGESFLISLSLALALSDLGQQSSIDTLFIDEGFGTLSGGPLHNAVNTLRTLHTRAGRHVGIISHIDELRDRIPTQIRLTSPAGSSTAIVTVTSE